MLAHEVACRLREEGRQVPFVGFFDFDRGQYGRAVDKSRFDAWVAVALVRAHASWERFAQRWWRPAPERPDVLFEPFYREYMASAERFEFARAFDGEITIFRSIEWRMYSDARYRSRARELRIIDVPVLRHLDLFRSPRGLARLVRSLDTLLTFREG